MTNLFKKEMLIYSFFDIKLTKPARVIWFAYFALLMAIWGAPILYIFWVPNVYVTLIAIGIPAGAATLMSKPIWGGKTFMDWAKTQVKYIKSKKYLYDFKESNKLKTHYVNSEFTVSRKRDFIKLAEMERKEREMYQYE